jgi:RHH-type proline utilization regulon transcriptional repressor/proline dehydrogenase/delta 1-pyrroline-5-carboxylate dehydrogenase
VIREIDRLRAPFATHRWEASSLTVNAPASSGTASREIINPAVPEDVVGSVTEATAADCAAAIAAARPWVDSGSTQRAFILRRAADLYENNAGELLALLAREAGKGLPDAIAELREAVDFLRYYANAGAALGDEQEARGVITCISPWNFPLAIFTGQIAAALAAGNAVLAKPAESTPLVATVAVRLLHAAGVPRPALQLLLGDGPAVGTPLTRSPRIDGVCFTGSTATAMRINASMAEHLAPSAPLIAETGGINAGIVDSTALPEQAIRDAIASAFQSAGQRCSALRVLYLQDDVADLLLEMLFGAMDELSLGDPGP